MKRFVYVLLGIFILLSAPLPLHSEAASPNGAAPQLKKIAVAAGTTQIVTEDGVGLSWGRMRGSADAPDQKYIPSVIEGLNDIIDMSVSNSHAVALKQDGSVWRWGGDGRVLEGGNQALATPVLAIEGAGIIQVQATQDHTYALKKDGTVLEWGDFYYDKNPPHLISGLDHVKSIYETYFIKEDGTVWTMIFGSSTATQVTKLSGVSKIAGYEYKLFLKDDGTVWSKEAILNGGKATNEPVQIQGLPKIKDITISLDTAFALGEDGNLYGWGNNRKSTLGDGTSGKAAAPKLILSDVRLLSSSDSSNMHMVIQKNDLSLWAWGNEIDGCLGVQLPNKKENAALPVQISFGWPVQNVWDRVVSLNMNGKPLFFATNKPYLTVKQEVMVPALSFAKQAGLASSLSNGTLKLSNNSNSITVTASGMKSGDGTSLSSTSSAQFVSGEVFVPFHAISDAFGLTSKYYYSMKAVGIFNSSFQAWSQLDKYGLLKRTTGLPKNASDFPYILAGVSNTYYEKAFPKTGMGTILNAAELYKSKSIGLPVELTEVDFARYANHITRYYQLLFNVDYRTINMEWAANLESHTGGAVSQSNGKPLRQLQMETYVNWIKNKKVIIQGNVRPEPSMISFRDGVLYMRTYFQYQIVQATASDYLKLRKDRIVQLISAPTGKSVIGNYAMYVDVPMVAEAALGPDSSWKYWSDALKVDARYTDIMPTPWEKILTFILSPG